MGTLTEEQLERAEKAFKSRDTNGDGKLTVAEFGQAIESFFTPEDFQQLLTELNPNGDDEISWEEFLADYENDL